MIKIGYFELPKKNVETDNQNYWREYFLTGTVSQSAPEYIKKAATIIDYVNLSKEEQAVTDALEKARATYDAQLLYAEEKGEEKGEENLAKLIRRLTEEKRVDEIELCVNDKEYRKACMVEFGIM